VGRNAAPLVCRKRQYDSISIIDTHESRVVETMPIKPFGLELKGVAPSALAVSPSGDRLFVALGGFNAVATVDTNKRARLPEAARASNPPFGGAPYPASIEIVDLVGPRDRLTVGLRLLLAIPHFVVLLLVLT
jgi:DNA-binding beta-propeller fold protein YncE